jgi:hypothetical protein
MRADSAKDLSASLRTGAPVWLFFISAQHIYDDSTEAVYFKPTGLQESRHFET